MLDADCRIGLEAEFWFVDPLNLDPETEDLASWGSRRIVAELLGDYLGTRVIAPREFRKRKGKGLWQVVPEHNLDPFCIPRDILCGVEIVSPPLRFEEFAEALRSICRLVGGYGRTDLNCGVHFNISIPQIGRLDALKLALLTQDEQLLRRFRRGHHESIISVFDELALRASTTPSYLGSNSREHAFLELAKLLPLGKAFSLNLGTWFDGLGYVEFRQCGGLHWERRYDALLDAAKTCVECVRDACNPSARLRSLYAAEKRLRKRARTYYRGELTEYARLRLRPPEWANKMLASTRERSGERRQEGVFAFVSTNELESPGVAMPEAS